jgi:indole-3-glycerol phosphate synthase
MTGTSLKGKGGHDILALIMQQRRRDVAAAKERVALRDLLWEAEKRRHHSLVAQLRENLAPRVIAEIKKASPSAGLLRRDYEPAAIALDYVSAGAAGLSVLTEPHYFQGDESHLRAVRAAVELPILRKDFVCDPYQLAEAAAWGADAVLLIAAALEPAECMTLHREAMELGLEVIVEVHAAGELDVALACKNAIVGVNSRNLKTLQTDLAVAMDLIKRIPVGRVRIAESGIKTAADLRRLGGVGYDGFLIGESLMRAPSPGDALRRLRRWN